MIDVFISNRQWTYLKLFREVAKLGPIFVEPGCPSLVTVDFEIGLWNAVSAVLPEAKVNFFAYENY